MLISVKLLAKYVIIIYALGSVHEMFESKPFQSRSTVEIPGRARRDERLSRSKLELEGRRMNRLLIHTPTFSCT